MFKMQKSFRSKASTVAFHTRWNLLGIDIFHARELTLMSSRNATGNEHQRITQLMEAGKINVTPWITHRMAYTSIVENFPRWVGADSAGIKVIVDW